MDWRFSDKLDDHGSVQVIVLIRRTQENMWKSHVHKVRICLEGGIKAHSDKRILRLWTVFSILP